MAFLACVHLALLRTPSFVFFAVHETRRIFLSPFISKASRRVSSFFLRVQLSHPYVATGTLALSLVVSSLKSVCCDFSAFSAVMPRSPALCLAWYRIPSYTHHLLYSGTLMSRLYLRLTRSRRSTNSCSSASEVANRMMSSA